MTPKHTGQTSPYSDETHLRDAESTRPLSWSEIERAIKSTEETIAQCREQIRRNEALLSLLTAASPDRQ